MVRDIAPEEVKLHNTERDCWIIVHNKVYDVSKYLNDHPGGVEIVTDLAGMDATADYDDVGHTQEAHEILEKFLIGHLKSGAPVVNAQPPVTPVKGETAKPVQAPQPAPPKPLNPIVQPVKPQLKPAPPQEDDSTMMIVAGVAVAAIAAGLILFRRSARA